MIPNVYRWQNCADIIDILTDLWLLNKPTLLILTQSDSKYYTEGVKALNNVKSLKETTTRL